MAVVAAAWFVLPGVIGRPTELKATSTPVTSQPAVIEVSEPSTTAKASSEPERRSAPIATMPSAPVKVLQANPIYQLEVPASCPNQQIPGSQGEFRRQVKELVTCLNAGWRKALKRTDIEFSKPKVKFYQTSLQSPCQKLGSKFPAAYCPVDQTLYFSASAYEQGKYYRLAVAQVVMHEYAHHVQSLAEIFEESQALAESSAVTTRRIELQAHCLAHYQLTNSEIGFTSYDKRDAEYQFDFTNDPQGHGSAKAERYWGERGLWGEKIGVCNTWKAKASRVK